MLLLLLISGVSGLSVSLQQVPIFPHFAVKIHPQGYLSLPLIFPIATLDKGQSNCSCKLLQYPLFSLKISDDLI